MENVIKKRKELKLTQIEFAEKFEIPIGTYKQWKTGRRTPPEYVLKMILTILNNEQ